MVVDIGGVVDVVVVWCYYSGKVEVRGFDIVDKVVVGDVVGVVEVLWWVMMCGELLVVLVDVFVEVVYIIGWVGL